jgi:hypothetical protein
VMVILKGGVPMSFGGSEEPTAYGELVSIGGLTPDKNKQLSASTCRDFIVQAVSPTFKVLHQIL